MDETKLNDRHGRRAPSTLKRRLLWPLGIFLLFFAAMAPTLAWMEFSSGSENLVVATVLEMRRTGRWLLPTLQGEDRTQKPPLAAWVTAAAVSDETTVNLTSPDPAVREAADRALGWETRWGALVTACLMLVAVYALASALDGPTFGALSALICGSCLLYLRYARFTTTDIHLALWVVTANAALAWAVLRGHWWAGCVIAGAALGLANMSKGPVAFVQSVVPFLVFAVWQRFSSRPTDEFPDTLAKPAAPPRVGVPILACVLLTLAVGLPWFLYVVANAGSVGQLLARWQSEVTRRGATDIEPSPVLNYLMIFAVVFPWIAFFVVGLIVSVRDVRRRTPERGAMLLNLLLLIVPIVVMSFAKDRKERYLVPMAAPAAIVAAYGVREHLRSWATWNRADTVTTLLHWGPLALVAVGLPIAGMFTMEGLRRLDRTPWYSPGFGVAAAVAGGVIVAAGAWVHRRRWRGGLVAGTVAAMLLLQAVFMYGYRHSREGLSEMKPLAAEILARVPDAAVYNVETAKRVPSDLSIYLNRTVRTLPDASSLAPAGVPQVIVDRQGHRDPPPLPPPTGGWHFLAKVRRDDTYWHAFVLPPSDGPTSRPASTRLATPAGP